MCIQYYNNTFMEKFDTLDHLNMVLTIVHVGLIFMELCLG